jgi:hypothetical protein
MCGMHVGNLKKNRGERGEKEERNMSKREGEKCMLSVVVVDNVS